MSKKTPLIVAILLIFFTGCTTSNHELQIHDFVAFRAGEVRAFESTQPHGDHSIVNLGVEGNRALEKTYSAIGNFMSVLENSDGQLRLIYTTLGLSGMEEDLSLIEPMMNIVILAEPLQVGNSWSSPIGVSTITYLWEHFETEEGVFQDVLEVTTEDVEGYHVVSYFARGIGLIKEVFSTYLTHLENGEAYGRDYLGSHVVTRVNVN